MAELWFQDGADGVKFRVFVQPRAARNQIVGIYDEALKISLTAPPVEGAANRLCRDFLAKALKIPRGRIEVVGGLKSRRKTIQIKDCSGRELLAQVSSIV